MNAGFKGVWIPSELWMKDDLTLMEKVFLVEIVSLDKVKGCYASNAHFSEFFSLSKTRCSAIIRKLRDKGYIFINYFYESGKKLIERRIIKVNRKNIDKRNTKSANVDKCKDAKRIKGIEGIERKEVEVIEELEDVGKLEKSEDIIGEIVDKKSMAEENLYNNCKNEQDHGKKDYKGDDVNKENRSCEEYKQNNAKIENQNDKEYKNIKKNEHKSIYLEIITYLNETCKTNYRHTSKKTQRSINARVREGYSIDDFKIVIDKKSAEWSNSCMKKYLRPETLFGTKFERYLNEDMEEKKNYFNNTNWRGGQAYGKQFENARDSRANEEVKEGARFSNTELTAEDLEWAAREMF